MLQRFFQRLSLKTYREDLKLNQVKLIGEVKLIHQQLFLNNPVMIVQNVKMYLPLFYVDHIQKIIYNERDFYEKETLNYLKTNYGTFERVLDIGSNIGNHMLYYCSRLQAKQVVCFEPNAFNHSVLCKNVELNNLQDIVTVHNVALGETGGKGIQKDFTTMNTGMNRVEPVAASETGKGTVDIVRLDDLQYRDIHFIKIDVEGFEVSVLKGAAETFRSSKAVVLIEVFKESQAEVDEIMNSYGYRKTKTIEEFNMIYEAK
ncbi:MAG: FkbM family methyltransferase [Lacibacter sp.]